MTEKQECLTIEQLLQAAHERLDSLALKITKLEEDMDRIKMLIRRKG